MQRKDTTVLDFMDVLNAFVEKLDNWQRKVEKGNFDNFKRYENGPRKKKG